MDTGIDSGIDGAFGGAKMALFLGDRLAVITRDDHDWIPWPGHLDFPGGGREGGETPWHCAVRECREELGITVPEEARLWRQAFGEGADRRWFFVACLPAQVARRVRLGDEGTGWQLMLPADYMSHPRRIPHFAERLRMALDQAPAISATTARAAAAGSSDL